MSWKNKVLDIIDGTSGDIYKLPDYKRIRLELIVVAYMILCFSVLIYITALRSSTFQTVLYSLGICSMILYFIQRSLKYQRFKFLSQFQKKVLTNKVDNSKIEWEN